MEEGRGEKEGFLSHAKSAGSDHKEDKDGDDETLSLDEWPSVYQVLAELRQLLRLGLPLLTMNVIMVTRTMVSMSFLGHLGGLPLAGGSMAMSFANITGQSLIFGLSGGLDPLLGQAFGAKRYKTLGLVVQRGILINFTACVPIAVLWLFQERLLVWAGQDKAIASLAQYYLLLLLPDLAAHCMLQPIRTYLRSQRITQPMMYCAALAIAIHVPINWFLVISLKLGMAGCALASAWTNFNLVCFLNIYLWRSGAYRLTWPGFSVAAFQDWGPLLRLALPTCAAICLEWWCFELVIFLAGLLPDPTREVATTAIVRNTSTLFYMLPWAISMSVGTRVGNELGANRPEKARLSSLVALGCAAVASVLGVVVFTFFGHIWGRLFTSDPEVVSHVALTLPICGLTQLGNCPQTTGCGILRGSARPMIGVHINLGAFYLVGIPLSLLLAFKLGWGSVGLWTGIVFAQATCAVLVLTAVFRTDWRREARRAQELTGGQAGEGTEMAEKDVAAAEPEEEAESSVFLGAAIEDKGQIGSQGRSSQSRSPRTLRES